MHPAESPRFPPAAATALLDRLGRLGGLVVAFSGGVDSAVVLAAYWNLTVRDKPSTPCLASRIAVGVPVTVGRLGLVERAELAVSGYLAEHRVPVRDLRVRLLGEAGFRVELDPEPLDGISGPARTGLLARVVAAGLRGEGDLACYHSGSLSG